MKIGREPSEMRQRKFFVKVVSTKKNPAYEILAKKIGELSISIRDIRLPEEDGLVLISTSANFGLRGNSSTVYNYTAAGTYADLNVLLRKLHNQYGASRMSWNIRQPGGYGFNVVPEHTHEYEPTQVQCGLCRSKFLHTKMDLNCTCPICKTENCCELEYEVPSTEVAAAG